MAGNAFQYVNHERFSPFSPLHGCAQCASCTTCKTFFLIVEGSGILDLLPFFFPFPVLLYVVCLIVVGVSQDEPVLDPGNPGDLRE